MKYRSITLLTAALLLTGCAAAQQTDPAGNLTEQTVETTGAETDAPITAQTVTQADITLPDLSAFGIDTGAFAPADEPYVVSGEYDNIAFDGEPPQQTFYAYYNPQKDRLLFDQFGRLRSYDSNEQTSWHMDPNPDAYTTVTDDESLKTTAPNGETAETLPPPSGSTPSDDYIMELDGGRLLHCREAYGAEMRTADELRSIADRLLDTIVPERETFTERSESILEATPSQIFIPCNVHITRSYNEDIFDSAFVSLDADGTVQCFTISYADITDLSVSERLREKAVSYAKEMYSSNPVIEDMEGSCFHIGDTDYGWYTVTFLFSDGEGCDEIFVRGD
jgi:hypothetical protein